MADNSDCYNYGIDCGGSNITRTATCIAKAGIASRWSQGGANWARWGTGSGIALCGICVVGCAWCSRKIGSRSGTAVCLAIALFFTTPMPVLLWLNILGNQYLKYCLDPPKVKSWALEMMVVAVFCAPLTLTAFVDCMYLAMRIVVPGSYRSYMKRPWGIYMWLPVLVVDLTLLWVSLGLLYLLWWCLKGCVKLCE